MVKCCCRELTAAHFSALVEYYMPQQKAKNSLKIPKGQPESVQHNVQTKKDKRTKSNLQNTTQKNNDRAARTN